MIYATRFTLDSPARAVLLSTLGCKIQRFHLCYAIQHDGWIEYGLHAGICNLYGGPCWTEIGVRTLSQSEGWL
jgi:hypothetical protein